MPRDFISSFLLSFFLSLPPSSPFPLSFHLAFSLSIFFPFFLPPSSSLSLPLPFLSLSFFLSLYLSSLLFLPSQAELGQFLYTHESTSPEKVAPVAFLAALPKHRCEPCLCPRFPPPRTALRSGGMCRERVRGRQARFHH